MAFHVFHTDREFNQTAIDVSARIIFDRAFEIMALRSVYRLMRSPNRPYLSGDL